MLTEITFRTVKIASGNTKSGVIKFTPDQLVAVRVPSGFSGSTIELEVARSEGGTYIPVDGFSLSVAGGNHYEIDPPVRGLEWTRLVAGTSQTADVKVGLYTRPL